MELAKPYMHESIEAEALIRIFRLEEENKSKLSDVVIVIALILLANLTIKYMNGLGILALAMAGLFVHIIFQRNKERKIVDLIIHRHINPSVLQHSFLLRDYLKKDIWQTNILFAISPKYKSRYQKFYDAINGMIPTKILYKTDAKILAILKQLKRKIEISENGVHYKSRWMLFIEMKDIYIKKIRIIKWRPILPMYRIGKQFRKTDHH